MHVDNPNKTYSRLSNGHLARIYIYECTYRRAAHFTRIMLPLLKHITGAASAALQPPTSLQRERNADRVDRSRISLTPRRWARARGARLFHFPSQWICRGQSIIAPQTRPTLAAITAKRTENQLRPSPAMPQRYRQSAASSFYTSLQRTYNFLFGRDVNSTRCEISPAHKNAKDVWSHPRGRRRNWGSSSLRGLYIYVRHIFQAFPVVCRFIDSARIPLKFPFNC